MLNSNPFSSVDVLVMEPNAFMRGMVRNILSEMGVSRVRETNNAKDAISAFKAQAADLVIADWSPDIDSLWMIKSLRCVRVSPYPYVPVIAMSGYTEIHTVCEARDLGIDWFLAKPLSARILKSHMLAAVQRRRAFIAETAYFGPDRRRGIEGTDFNGTNRRSRLAA